MSGKSVSLVLGSGGARGLAHIGIIRELESAGFQIKAISGASIGALVGGAFATGKLAEFENWARAINRISIIGLMDVNWGPGGLLRGDKIREAVTHLFGDWQIEDLPIKYTAVAVDIVKEKEVWISRGSLSDAMRASISLPLFMSPILRRDAILVDGGVLNPVPIGPTLNDDTDMTVAVNLGGLPETTETPKAVEGSQAPDQRSVAEKIKDFIEGLAPPGTMEKEEKKELPDMLNVADRTFDVMQNSIARQKIAANPPDYLIEIPRNASGILEFDRAAELIDLGHEKAKALIDQMMEA